MYSQKKIQKTLEAFEKSEGWTPVYHTLDEVNEFKEEIKKLTKIGSNSKSSWIESIKPISEEKQKEVARWIQNEQVLCAIDSGYFESRYVYITDECGLVVKFQNQKSQEVFESVIADLEEKDSSIELLILSSSRQGLETKILLKIIHRLLFCPYTQSVMSALFRRKTEHMEEFINAVYDKLPFWLVPMMNKKGRYDNGSIFIFQSGLSPYGIAQGFTPNCVLVEDAGLIPNPVKIIEEGLLRETYSSRNLFMVITGQKESEQGWLTDFYKHSKKYYHQEMSRFVPIYIPWVMSDDIYPRPVWLKVYPIPKGWRPLRKTIDHKNKCETFIRTTPYLSKILGNEWKMPKEQQWFWENQYTQAKLRGSLESFERNFAPDDGLPLDEKEGN